MVQRLRERGRRLAVGERALAERGELTILVEPAKRAGRPARRVAQLTEWVCPPQPKRCIWQPLFDPRLVSLDGEVLILAGIELNMGETADEIFETYQIWRCIRYVGDACVVAQQDHLSCLV